MAVNSSSTALFSNQGNPFPSPVKSRTHYHPSQLHPLTEEQKKTVLSPTHLHSLPSHLSGSLSPSDLSFLRGAQRCVPGLAESDSSGPFDESWPSTEDSSSKTPERDERRITSPTRLNHIVRISHSTDTSPEDSVIARYMERFRKALPTSRHERSITKNEVKDFWWLQTSTDSPDAARNQTGTGITVSPGLSPQNLDLTPPHEGGSLNDSKYVDTLALQERAGKLILRSESSLSSVGPVSCDGVGSSTLSNISNIESDLSKTRQPSPTHPAPAVPFQTRPIMLTTPPIRAPPTLEPEEDILYQWRLRRKMEQAREGTLAFTTRKRTPSPPVRIPKQVEHTMDFPASEFHGPRKVTAQTPCIPTPRQEQGQKPAFSQDNFPIASPSLTQQTCSVPAHLHLACDIMPCVHSLPLQSCMVQWHEKDPIKQVLPHPLTLEATVPAEEMAKRATGGEKQKILSTQPPQKASMIPVRQELKKTKLRREKPRRAGSKSGLSEQKSTRDAEHMPPGSPVHCAMGEVISERLFSPLASPDCKPEVKKFEGIAPPAESTNHHQPMEMAAQLLEEAEDSDGTEFGDDPLLQVLRDQREALRRRLRAVDLRLTELEFQSRTDLSPLH
ncbi:proline and serine-rich protein 3 [Rhinophrynus dorsalis]